MGENDWEIFDVTTLKSITQNFLKELEAASRGEKTSLPFIRHALPANPLVGENENFQVMVMGGSFFKKALCKKSGKKIVVRDKYEEKLTPFATIDDLFALAEKHLNPEVGVIAINFAYPMSPVLDGGRLDGVLISGTKEHDFAGLVGKMVGETLEKHFWEKYNKKIIFTLANDTVCLLLSGLKIASQESLGGGIVGTGFNLAFFLDANELVNLESANFNKFPLSEEAHEIDTHSSQPGKSLFEKETTGAYLYQHFNSIIKKRNIQHSPIFSTEELNRVAISEDSQASIVARNLFKKSAGLVSCQIAGITLFKKCDMTFVMEGSLFWKADKYKAQVVEFLKMLAPEWQVAFTDIEEGQYLGAAKLVT